MSPQFFENLLVELIAVLTDKGIDGAISLFNRAKSDIQDYYNYQQFVKDYFKDYPQLSVVERNMRKNMNSIVKCIARGLRGQIDVQATYNELSKLLRLPPEAFKTDFVTGLFNALWPVVVQMLPAEDKHTLDVLADMETAKAAARIADISVQTAAKAEIIADATSRTATALETFVKIQYQVYEWFLKTDNTTVSKEEKYTNPTFSLFPQKTAIGNVEVEYNKFYVLLNRLKGRCCDQKHKKLEGRDKLVEDIKSWLDHIIENQVAFCSLIGPGGAGKTHIGLDIAKEQFAGFQPYYFEKIDFDYLHDILKNYLSDIKFKEDTLLIFDYVYEQIDVIRKFISHVERNNNAPYRIAIMFIERNSELETRNQLPHSRKFLINVHPVTTETPVPTIYSLTVDNLAAILKNTVPVSLQPADFGRQCYHIADQVANHIDPIYRRPIFIIFIAEMMIDVYSNHGFFLLDVGSRDALIEKYWTWKTNFPQDPAFQNLFEEFSKVIITCAAALNRNIRITYSTEDNTVCKVSIPRATQPLRKYIVPLIEAYLSKFDKQFLASDSFRNYMERLCKTKYYSPFEIGNLCIVIKPEKDLITEWLVHRAYMQYKVSNGENNWLRYISRALLSYSPNGYIALLNRGVIDFPDLVWIIEDPNFYPNEDYDKFLGYCILLLRNIANIELDRQEPSGEMVSIVKKVLNKLSLHEDYFNTEEDAKKMLDIYFYSMLLRGNIDYMKSCCRSLISSLPDRDEPDDPDERSLRRA